METSRWLEQLERKCRILWHAALTVTPPLWWHTVPLRFPITAVMIFKDMKSIIRLYLVSLPYSPVPQFAWEITKRMGAPLEWMISAAHVSAITRTSLWKFEQTFGLHEHCRFGSDRCCGFWNHSEKNREWWTLLRNTELQFSSPGQFFRFWSTFKDLFAFSPYIAFQWQQLCE